MGPQEHPEWRGATHSDIGAPEVNFSAKPSQNNTFHNFTSNPSFSKIFDNFDQVWPSWLEVDS